MRFTHISKPVILLCLMAMAASPAYLPAYIIAQENPTSQEKDKDKDKKTVEAARYEIIVTATKTEHALGDVPVAAEVVTREEIVSRGIKTVQDALALLSGIKISRDSGSWGNVGKVQIQGLDAKHTLILVDGQRMLGGHGDAVDLEQVSIEMVERIEVVKGPSSSLYGSDAMGGVVNIITRSAPARPSGSLSTSFGTPGTQVHEASGGFRSGRFGAFLDYSFRRSDGVARETDEYGDHVLQGTLQYELGPKSTFSLKPYFSEHDIKYEDRKQVRFGINSIWEWAPDEASKVKARCSWNDYSHWTADRSTDVDSANYEAEVDYSRRLFGRHNVTGGLSVLREDLDDHAEGYGTGQTLLSAFVQDEMSFKPFILVLGGRLDEHDRWGSRGSFSTAVLFNVSADLKLRASVGTGFKGPTLIELSSGTWSMGPYLVHSNPDLKPEYSTGYQFGAEYVFARGLTARLSLFRNDIENLISNRFVGRDMYWENVNRAMTRGMELDLSARVSAAVSARLGWTVLDTEDKLTGLELTYRAGHKLALAVDWDFRPLGLRLNVEGEYIGRRFADAANTARLGGYALLNCSADKDLGKALRLFARVDNILGRTDIADEYDIHGVRFLCGLKARL